jgi:O-antigen ligase
MSLPPRLSAFGRRGWLDSPPARRIAMAATAAGLLLAAVLPDALANIRLLQVMTAAIAVLAVVLILTVRWPRPGLTDVGLVVLVAATLWPRVAHVQPGVPGALLFILATYGIGRFSGLRPRTLALLLLAAGAIMGAIALTEAMPALSKLAFFHPIRGGLPSTSTRPAGMFNNPNVFGTYEAMTLVLAASVGLPLGWGKTWLGRGAVVVLVAATALCIVGLGLSASRESAIAATVGLGVVAVLTIRSIRGLVKLILPYAIAAGMAVVVVLVASSIGRPNLPSRFNPTTVSTDHALLSRIDSWRLAVSLIRRAPILGYGATIPMRSVDNAYLEWTLGGGFLGLFVWLAAVATVVPRAAWSLLAAILVIAAFANPFAVGPGLAILLISCGALASHPLEAAPQAASASEPPAAAPAPEWV